MEMQPNCANCPDRSPDAVNEGKYLLLLVLVLLNLRSCLFEEHMKRADLELGSDCPSFAVPIVNLSTTNLITV